MSQATAADVPSTKLLAVDDDIDDVPNVGNDEPLSRPGSSARSHDNPEKEDPATTAASETLKHASISDHEPLAITPSPNLAMEEPPSKKEERHSIVKSTTPERSNAYDDEMKDSIVSPKKKRVRENDDTREAEEDEVVGKERIPSNGSIVNGRTERLAPEKKRHRDASEESSTVIQVLQDPMAPTSAPTEDELRDATESKILDKLPAVPAKSAFGGETLPQTSASAFAASGFGSLVSSTSGFAALGGSGESVFGKGTSAPVSGFAKLAAAKLVGGDPSTKSTFATSSGEKSGSGFGSGFGATQSGFGSLGSGFGAGFGGTFGNALSGGFASDSKKLTSFATTSSTIAPTEKPAKAFGAPESDLDEDSDDSESQGDMASDEEEKVLVEDKKKLKMPRVPVQDGEEDEATLLQLRAKLYAWESVEKGWKERGVGNLKVNVHKTCIEYDEYSGLPVQGSFDPSLRGDDDDEPVVAARLIMRQENTHRVILNTMIVKALKFEEKQAQNSVQVLFTAFDGGKPINLLLRMSETNARLLTSEIASIQSELP